MMHGTRQGVTLLWALRSPCNLNCLYCYFGTGGGDGVLPTSPGALSHNGHTDVPLAEILSFIHTFSPGDVRRVFVAGGEPLIWLGTPRVITALKQAGCEVILCTNGLPLQREATARLLLDLDVDAVSVSLDSFDATYHDQWRQDRSGQGWAGVVAGIQTLLRMRNEREAATRVGVYSVITQQNLAHLAETGRFVDELGADYFIVQPVSLAPDHPLQKDLCLDVRHRGALLDQLRQLHEANLRVRLAHPDYLTRVVSTLSDEPLPIIQGCFGGRDLFFIEPDGSVWDCPSSLKIQHTLPMERCSIRSSSAARLFSAERRCRNTDCTLFSQDCVNMWQLMLFDRLLSQGGRVHDQLI